MEQATPYYASASGAWPFRSTCTAVCCRTSAYLGAYKDKNNVWFDGSKTYRLRVPANPPAKNLWSLTI